MLSEDNTTNANDNNSEKLEIPPPKKVEKSSNFYLKTTRSHCPESFIEKVDHGAVKEVKPKLQLIKMSEVAGQDKVYQLTIVNQGSAMANINIKNDQDEVIFTKSEVLDGNYARLFNLKQIHTAVSFEVTVRDETVAFNL